MVDYGCDTCFHEKEPAASIYTRLCKNSCKALLCSFEKVLNRLLPSSLVKISTVLHSANTTPSNICIHYFMCAFFYARFLTIFPSCHISKTKIAKHLWLSWGQDEAWGILSLRNIRICKRLQKVQNLKE